MWTITSFKDAARAVLEIAALDAEEGDEEATSRRLHSLADAVRSVVSRGEATPGDTHATLDHVRATLKLRHLGEASDEEVEEALRLADAALAGPRV